MSKKTTNVKSYRRRDGTFVEGHTRVIPKSGLKTTREFERQFKTKTRIKQINKELYALTSNKYFKHVPMDEISDSLRKAGYKLPEEGYILTGHDGKATWPLYDYVYGEETKHILKVTWHRMDSGRFEIVTYVD